MAGQRKPSPSGPPGPRCNRTNRSGYVESGFVNLDSLRWGRWHSLHGIRSMAFARWHSLLPFGMKFAIQQLRGTLMRSNPRKLSSDEVAELRREAGRYLRELRESRGLSQRGLAELVGAEYYSLISQLEMGRWRIPPDRYSVWAKALGIEKKEFVRSLMQYYDPITYAILFGT